MTNWPKWLRATFLVSGGLFVLAVLFSVYVLTSQAVIPPLSVVVPSQPSSPEPPTIKPSTIVNAITAVTGLLTALSGLYGQILAARKQQMDYELARQQAKRETRSAASRKTNRRRKKA